MLTEVLEADPAAWARAVADRARGDREGAWLKAWRAGDGHAARAIAATLGGELSEPAVAGALSGLDPEVTVFTASSMPVRDVETFWPVTDEPPRVLAHRGANGIDGTIAAAYGAAAAGARVVAHLGDVALAHDLGALLSGPRLDLAVTIVLVDNGGGAIFDALPVAGETDVFEIHVATPPGLDARRVAALFGLAYEPVRELAQIREAPGTLLHVRTERAENLALHRRVWAAVAEALED